MNKLYKYAVVALTIGLGLQACKKDNAEYSVLRNRAYIAQTETKANAKAVINVSEDQPAGTTATLNVRLSDRQTVDNKYRLVPFTAQELESYNVANGTSFVALDQSKFQLPTDEVVIKAGSTVSDGVNIKVLPLNTEEIRSGKQFVLPLKLKAVSGSSIIQGGDEYVYQVKPTIVSSVPVLGTDPITRSYLKAQSEVNEKEITTTQWTVEMRVNMSGFARNNQAIFAHSGRPEIYARFGDAPIPFNSINIKSSGSQIDRSNMLFEPNRWYHVAFVYNGTTLAIYVDGVKDIETDKMAGKTYTFKGGMTTAGSGSQWFPNGLMIQELRVWTVARTPQQLKEYEYAVPATTPGLLEYWKMDEGSGREFKNSVAGGKSMFVFDNGGGTGTPRWLGNVRSDGAGRTRID